MYNIQITNKKDIEYLKKVIDSTKLFPSELLEDMIADFFTNPNTNDIWLTIDIENIPIALAYVAPERMTAGTYNLYLIAVHKDYQGKGIGTQIVNYIEEMLRKKGVRILIVETSSLPEFELTRKFYKKQNYHCEATIREFYQEGEDKIIFWKKLNE